MKRELGEQPGKQLLDSWCCPGHDTWPCETYKNRRSKRARARDKRNEHQLARTIANRNILKQLEE